MASSEEECSLVVHHHHLGESVCNGGQLYGQLSIEDAILLCLPPSNWDLCFPSTSEFVFQTGIAPHSCTVGMVLDSNDFMSEHEEIVISLG